MPSAWEEDSLADNEDEERAEGMRDLRMMMTKILMMRRRRKKMMMREEEEEAEEKEEKEAATLGAEAEAKVVEGWTTTRDFAAHDAAFAVAVGIWMKGEGEVDGDVGVRRGTARDSLDALPLEAAAPPVPVSPAVACFPADGVTAFPPAAEPLCLRAPRCF